MYSALRSKFTRKPTTQQSGIRRTTTTLPRPQPEVDLTSAPASVPSYAHADAQKGAQDTEAEIRGKEDDTIEQAQGRAPATDTLNASIAQPSNKGKGTERHTEPHSQQQAASTEDNFQSFWHNEIGYDVIAVQFGDYNEWTPNSLALFEMLEVSGYYIRNNRMIRKNHTDYLDYSVACYYSIIFYVQILRARKAAGKLTGEESSFLRRFDRAYPEESLPVADWMFPILSSIVSTQVEDSKYEWIVPRIATENFFGHMNDIQPGHGSIYLQPMVPYMLSILRVAVSKELDLNAVTGNNLTYFNDEDQFIPGRITNAAQTFFGIDNLRHGINPTAIGSLTVFSGAGTSFPFHADADDLSIARKQWATTKFRNLRIGAINPGGADVLHTNPAINTLETFLCMPKSENIEWFGELVNQAAINARFGKKVYNLSQVPQTGGTETLLLARLKNQPTGTPRVINDYASTQLDVTNANFNWYPQHFTNLTAGFGCTRAELKRSEVLQASAFATNATLPIINGAVLVGGRHANERLADTATNRPNHAQRIGEYWRNTEYTYTMFDFEEPNPTPSKPMFNGWKSMFQNKFYQQRPTGY
nr:capsid protein [Sarcosphaera coronaria partitivirus]